MSANATPRADIYSRVTSKIVSDLENGVRTWLKPWSVEHTAGRITRPLRATGQPYNGINVLMLWADSVSKGFVCPIWMTYRQASELGANVRKGEHGSPVVYADRIKRTETNANGEDVETAIPFLKGYTVFNCEQIEGLPAHFYPTSPPAAAIPERISAAETFAANTRAEIRLGGNRAYYSVTDDHVRLPPFESFRDTESYYATMLHELTHYAEPSVMPRRSGFARKTRADRRKHSA
jgi:antirestriction protein ArdC